MLPSKHIILGFIFSLIIFYLFPEIGLLGVSLIFLSSFLIDIDHYFYYAYTKKDFNPINARNWFMKKHREFIKLPHEERRKRAKNIPCIFHGIEMIMFLILLSFISPLFIYILMGFIFHESLDLINILYFGFSLDHIGSQTYNIINHKIEE